ncbi:hypothetical protein [Mucisphaera calidilacus]|uniref:PEP-CTERM protein-sorting domain-containing protein n=1 Tax=Mucisphaera calidilacus TaxID=2527982 RepID=A0A518BTE7_9BACT|nr:hypothetical protein [Mucisphaera calidilacus]QDU70244.1 hypothetical protein Pan265_00660 [Mucisphaera calidilacus]
MRNALTTAAALAAATTAAQASTVITFSEFGLGHGDVVTNQYAGVGLTVKANNASTSASNDPAVIFDTTQTGTRDPDLEDPWSGGNIPANTVLGNALIIQEKNVSPGTPDDEGRRPAGTLVFDFSTPITSIGFDFIDFEGIEASNSWVVTLDQIVGSSNKRVTIDFTDFTDTASAFYTPGIVFGNNTANTIYPIDIADLQDLNGGMTHIDKVTVHFGGSGAIDNLTYTQIAPPPSVPTPAAFGAGLAALGILAIKRR